MQLHLVTQLYMNVSEINYKLVSKWKEPLFGHH